ncbi:hypothetical protein [Flavobacterium sp. UBA4197]|uniref:hypothetical protein n=1 Tax=Flavobacterium sp. UBA4197 TaxID=1946546 RepID=UPI00257FDF99|nr:hypothetical protein [Flavobacterium sp. UBA4197]HRB72433.1 hypothetical protein [Flavobacterium sp.]
MGKDRQTAFNRAVTVLQARGIDVSKAKFLDRTVYINFDAKGAASKVDLIDSNTKKLEGITNFDGPQLNANRHWVIDSISIKGDDEATAFGKAKWKSALHPALLNSEIRFSQDGTLIDMPVTDLHNVDGIGGLDDDFREMIHAPVVVPNLDMKLEWVFPKGESVPGSVTSSLVNIRFRVIEAFV